MVVIRAEVSQNNKYWISKHRHYELKYFCLQYPLWKEAYKSIDGSIYSSIDRLPSDNLPGDPTGNKAMLKAFYSERIKMVEETALATDESLYEYILKGVTEGLSYTQLKTRFNIPCGKDMYYERYRRFFWLLNNSRR